MVIIVYILTFYYIGVMHNSFLSFIETNITEAGNMPTVLGAPIIKIPKIRLQKVL